MFNNSRLYFFEEVNGYLNDEGLWVSGSTHLDALGGNIPCDKQPYSHDLAWRDYGYDGNVVYRVFCDYDNRIKLGAIVSFTWDHAEEYQIKKIVNWDNKRCEVLIDNV